jgi:histidinol phosphate phosphatase HisJ family
MKTLLNNYHTHTSRCNHAIGSDEEYVLEAIKHGMKTLGFSDHIPLKYAGINNKMEFLKYRMDYLQQEDYFNSINYLKEKYKDQIKIYLGFETEFIIEEEQFYFDLLNNKIIDYLILGVHVCDVIDLDYMVGIECNPNKIKLYTNHCLKQMQKDIFKYLAHPDLYMRDYPQWDQYTIEAAELICTKSKELNFPIELNCEGIRSGIRKYNNIERYTYPVKEFWEIAAKHQCPVIIGVDAHKPEDLNSESIQIAFKWAKELNLNLIPNNEILI